MKTDDLIAALATDLPPEPKGRLQGRIALFTVLAALAVLAGVIVGLGLRPDLEHALGAPGFWARAAYTAGLGVAGFWLLGRLGRPGAPARAPATLLVLILAAGVAAGAADLAMAAPSARMGMVMDRSTLVCPTNILLLSAIGTPFVFLAARRLAPVRPGLAGAAAGLLTAGLAATLYGLHCVGHHAVFVAVWYTLGIAVAAGAGALIGRFALRW